MILAKIISIPPKNKNHPNLDLPLKNNIAIPNKSGNIVNPKVLNPKKFQKP